MIIKTKYRALRMQYLTAFVILWSVLGLFSALLLSSAGPVYYDQVVGGLSPYEPLMDALKNTDAQFNGDFFRVQALGLQDKLWLYHNGQQTNIGSGISVMPSMHVAQTTLLFLLARGINENLGRAMFAFLITIMIGSVHLGWHYALDGYLSVILTVILWKLSGFLIYKVNGVDKIRGAYYG